MSEEVIVTFDEDYELNQDMDVLNVKRSILAEQEIRTQKLSRMAGEHFLGKTEGMRRIEIEAVILDDGLSSFQDLLDEIADKLYSDRPKKLTFSDEKGFYQGILSETTEYDQFRASGEVTLIFLCPRPHRYGEEVEEVISGSGGVITREGRKEVYPTIKATFSESTDEFQLRKKSTGDQIRIQYDFTSNSVLEFNMARREIDINSSMQTDRLDIGVSTFFTLDKETDIEIVSDGVDEVTISYRGRWR